MGEHIEVIAPHGNASSVDRAETEQQAIRAALANPPAVILLDVQLVEGTGPNAVWAIGARLGLCPVIFITGTPEACEPCDYAHCDPGQAPRPTQDHRGVPSGCADVSNALR